MSESEESAKRAVDLVRIFKDLPAEDQKVVLEFVKNLRDRLQH